MEDKSYFNGFLRADGRKVVNGQGDEVLLTGWGVGNWLLCEGYMWLSGGGARLDRPHRIEQVVRELIGTEKANDFWTQYRENYITEWDIAHMKQLGYNSVRIPFNWRLFMEDEPGIIWKAEGFALIERCIKWCEKYELYAFLDMHGAPGGQTGANIDDCIDDVPRLFIDADKWQKGVALWEELAKRYSGNTAVGGYDILNEPIRPARDAAMKDYTYLLPKLSAFYDEAIVAIRKHDKNHMISLEGHHWSTDVNVFHKKFDDNMIIHFHRYGVYPQRASFDKFLDISKRWNAPLWLGETGENKLAWYSAYFQLVLNYGIGYNLWPYKKMGARNCPCLIKPPADWDSIVRYSKGDAHPGYAKAESILNEYLENMKFENCELISDITNYTMRKAPFFIQATDFDEDPNRCDLFKGSAEENNVFQLRDNTGIRIVEERPPAEKEFRSDTQWDRFLVVLHPQEFVTYTVNEAGEGSLIRLECAADSDAVIQIAQNGMNKNEVHVGEENKDCIEIPVDTHGRIEVRIECVHGKIYLRKIHVG